jgi:hypothetical protein
MCVACGQELCKNCHECHNPECERYVEPSETCKLLETTIIVEDAEWRDMAPSI